MTNPFTARSFTPADLADAARVAVAAATAVAPTLREHFGATDFSTKQDERDWVTRWDVWAEERIRDTLANSAWGDIGQRGEEGGEQSGSERRDVYWTIDPIDGTSHFVRGNEFCTTMLALVDHGVPVVGVIHDFIRGHTYTATAGQGAYLNHTRRLSVSRRPLPTAQLELYTDEQAAPGRQLRALVEQSGACLLRTSASGFTFVGVARGAIEGFVTFRDPHCSEWDIAPGCLLVHEAGGVVRNIGSDRFHSRNLDYIAANPAVYAAVDAILDNLGLRSGPDAREP